MKNNLWQQLDRVDVIIITVGTRQVGWRCQDGAIRCLGADGDRGHPPHINQLYQELGITRSFYEEGNPATLWAVRDLGQRFYQYCQQSLAGNFSQVELLLDHQIIADSVAQGLRHVILWATDQPESVPWVYRRADTYWLAKLMERKIKAIWPLLQVDVLHPQVVANDKEAIRHELENLILPFAIDLNNAANDSDFVLFVQNKGAAPAIAESLEICAAALVRQFQVINATPQEPVPLYENYAENVLSSRHSQEYQLVPVSSYFWPLERSRVISAWQRGDFQEAQVWLAAHQSRYKQLYQLAGYLAIATNWEINKFIANKNLENGWLQSRYVRELAGSDRLHQWRSHLLQLRQDEFLQAWESTFLISLQLERENYTTAFMKFAQTLERLLYIHSLEDKWVEKNLIRLKYYDGNPLHPSFNDLINAWQKVAQVPQPKKSAQRLHAIREKRNKIVHNAQPVTRDEMQFFCAQSTFALTITDDPNIMMQMLTDVLKQVCAPSWQIPDNSLLHSLYQWGLGVLKSKS